MLVSHSHTRWHFVLWDLICLAAPLVTYSSSLPPLSPSTLSSLPPCAGRLKAKTGDEISICKISEVTVTQVAELRLWQSLAGLKPALICRLFLRLAHCIYYSAMMFAALRLQPRYSICCDFNCCCSKLFHLDNILKQIQVSMIMWTPTTTELILPTIHSKGNVKTNNVIKQMT